MTPHAHYGKLQAILPDPGCLFTLLYSGRYSVDNSKKCCPIYTKALAELGLLSVIPCLPKSQEANLMIKQAFGVLWRFSSKWAAESQIPELMGFPGGLGLQKHLCYVGEHASQTPGMDLPLRVIWGMSLASCLPGICLRPSTLYGHMNWAFTFGTCCSSQVLNSSMFYAKHIT